MVSEKLKAILAVLLGNFFFATSIVAVKHISPSLITPIALTSLRVGGTAFLFWLFLFAVVLRMLNNLFLVIIPKVLNYVL